MSYICGQYEIPEGDYMDTDHREMTSEDIRRETFNASQQRSISGTNTSGKETLNLGERVEQLDKECRLRDSVNKSWRDDFESRLQFLEQQYRELSGRIIQKDVPEKEECEKLKEKIRDLEARNQMLLSKVMSMHAQSENMNDPFRLTAVLDMFRTLKLQEWGKCWSSSSRLSYSMASNIMQKLFVACKGDIKKRKTDILEILGFTSLHHAANSCKQELKSDIVKILRHGYYHNDSGIYKIIKDSPVNIVWNIDECSLHHIEHVDQRDLSNCEKVKILWPVLKDGEEVIEKGVVWEEN